MTEDNYTKIPVPSRTDDNGTLQDALAAAEAESAERLTLIEELMTSMMNGLQ